MDLKKNSRIIVRIESFGAQGEGIARVDGMPIFIPYALPGEEVTAQIVKTEKKYAFGKMMELLKTSNDRTEPACPYYRLCGSCSCQHMQYDTQLQFKRNQVESCMRHIGGSDVAVPPVIGADDPWHYRNKISMPVSGEAEKPLIGYYAFRSHRVVDIRSCLLAKEPSDRACAGVREWMIRRGIDPYREDSGTGLIRHVMTRINRQGEVMVVLVVNGKKLPEADELLKTLRGKVPEMISFCVSHNEARGNVILGKRFTVLWGSECLEDTLCGNRFLLSPLSFFQVNSQQTEKLYKTALDYAGLTGKESVADLYCGAGTISLLLAGRAAHVTGIEIVPDAVRDARNNAVRNQIGNTDFVCGPAEEVLPELVRKGMRPDTVVMDPPRKGADEKVLLSLAECGPEKIVYISCNPATLARDIKTLAAYGYRADRCQPVDMFCQTAGIETICRLNKT